MSCRHSVWRSSLIKNLASNMNSITIYISPFSMELLTVSLSDHHRTPDFSSIMSQVSCLSKKSVKKLSRQLRRWSYRSAACISTETYFALDIFGDPALSQAPG